MQKRVFIVIWNNGPIDKGSAVFEDEYTSLEFYAERRNLKTATGSVKWMVVSQEVKNG